eukprot:scaffold579_cov146-Ochromonas_danica.AAC.4
MSRITNPSILKSNMKVSILICKFFFFCALLGSQLLQDNVVLAVKRATDIPQIKRKILSLAANTANGVKASPIVQDEIRVLTEQIAEGYQLPTAKTFENLMGGQWSLAYTTNREFSSGKVGPFVGKVIQRIDTQRVQYSNSLLLFGGLFAGELRGTWRLESPSTWRIIFQEAELKVLGLSIQKKSMLGQEGLWRTVFLDEDLRIFYAKNALRPYAPENLYVLSRLQ